VGPDDTGSSDDGGSQGVQTSQGGAQRDASLRGAPVWRGARSSPGGSGLLFSLGECLRPRGHADTVYNGDAMCGGAAAAGRLLSGRWRGPGHPPGIEAPRRQAVGGRLGVREVNMADRL
jgi:hypothetical protein